MKTTSNILVILPSWIGDTIMSQSLLFELKRINNNCNIDVIARPYISELVNLIPQINKKIFLDIKHGNFGLLDRLNLVREIKKNQYTDAYILPNSFKSALVPWLAGIPNRIGYTTEFRQLLLTKKYKYRKHERTMVERYLHLANCQYHSQIQPKLKISTHYQKSILEKFQIKGNQKIIMLCPDAEYGSAKKWPVEHWLSLARLFCEKNFSVFFLGKDTDFEKSLSSEDGLNDVRSLIGQTTLLDVAYLLSISNLAISNDSGLMHIAGSVDSKIIAIYGSSSPKYTPPLISEDSGEVIYKDLSCSPCFKRECPLSHLNCLRSITAKETFDIALNYL